MTIENKTIKVGDEVRVGIQLMTVDEITEFDTVIVIDQDGEELELTENEIDIYQRQKELYNHSTIPIIKKMEITRTSTVSGITRTLDLDVTFEEIAFWQAGELIQNAMPRLNADEREFIKTGITSQEWEELFGGEE